MIPHRTLNYQGRKIDVHSIGNGNYADDKGTIYPAILFDHGYCGLDPIETGRWDPFWKTACAPHDKAFNLMKLGYSASTAGNFGVFSEFAKNIGATMLQGAYAVTMGIPYLVVGGIGGLFRWWQVSPD